MSWPWVGRAALDAVTGERDRLRAQVDSLLEHVTRMDRVANGLTETPRQPKEPDPMPESLRRKIQRFGTSGTVQDQLSRARRAHHEQRKSWAEIESEFDASVGVE